MSVLILGSTNARSSPPVVLAFPEIGEVLWQSSFEGDIKDELGNSSLQRTPCGGEYSNDGGAAHLVADKFATGQKSVLLTIPGMGQSGKPSGVRLHRWCESQRYRDLYYAVKLLFPQLIIKNKGGWTNWVQFKSKRAGRSTSEPIFFLDIYNAAANREMYFMLTWWAGLDIEGPQPGQNGYRTWRSTIPIPINEWIDLRVNYVCTGSFDGRLVVWQDRKKIFELNDIRTKYPDGDCQWGINNYGINISPEIVKIYVDDAVIYKIR